MKTPLLKVYAEPVDPMGTCATAGCGKKANWRVKTPKKSDMPGNKFMTRYVCFECKDKALAFFAK